VDVDPSTVVEALEGNGCAVSLDHEVLTATPPSWRFDLNDPNDLVEEVLRVVGYDQVPSIVPVAPAGRGLTKAQKLRRRVGYVLAGDGLVEVKTFPFAGPADFDRLGLPPDDVRRRQVLLENPLSAEEPGLTTTLLTGLLKTLVLNIGRGHADVQITETGRVFLPRSTGAEAPILGVDRRPTDEELAAFAAALPEQPHHVGLVLTGERARSGWAGPGRQVSWADAVAIVRHVAEALHVEVEVEAAQVMPWHPGRCAAILLDGEPIGHAGELHPRVLKAYGLPARVAAAEIDLDALIAAAPEIGPRPAFSSFPVAKEDLALIVDDAVPAAAVQRALATASPLIESVRLFDVYVGDQVPEGQKSLAFALRLRAPDRTLTDEDIRSARDAAVTAARATTGATLRT
jgi:phenylalanyl-tRNA synthetase beta chain